MPESSTQQDELVKEISACRLCQSQFSATKTAHEPRPVTQLSARARILICGQAPGARVHASGKFFDDPSGDRLRDWLGVNRADFYNPEQFAILPMAFCFPGYDAKGSDLPPPPLCARTWRKRALEALPAIEFTILIGRYAQIWHMGAAAKGGVTATVRNWRATLPQALPLPHPSWRNNTWLKRNPWFEQEVLPELQKRVSTLKRSGSDGIAPQ